MTNLEAAKVSVGQNYPFDEGAYNLGLVSAGLDPDALFVAGKDFDLALAAFITYLIAGANRISEGGYTVEFDADALFKLRAALLAKWDVPDYTGATLRDRTYKW